MKNKDEFRNFVKARREELKLSRAVFAKRVEVSQAYVYDIEAGRYELGENNLMAWARALELDDPRQLYEIAGEKFPIQEPPQNFIPLPFNFPVDSQKQVEDFVKFLQYRDEFYRFLELGGSMVDRDPTREEIDAFAREVQEAFSPTPAATQDQGNEESINKRRELR